MFIPISRRNAIDVICYELPPSQIAADSWGEGASEGSREEKEKSMGSSQMLGELSLPFASGTCALV